MWRSWIYSKCSWHVLKDQRGRRHLRGMPTLERDADTWEIRRHLRERPPLERHAATTFTVKAQSTWVTQTPSRERNHLFPNWKAFLLIVKWKSKLQRHIQKGSMEMLLLVDGLQSAVKPDVVESWTDCFKAEQQPLFATGGQDDGAHQACDGEGDPAPQVVADPLSVHLAQLLPQEEADMAPCNIHIVTWRPNFLRESQDFQYFVLQVQFVTYSIKNEILNFLTKIWFKSLVIKLNFVWMSSTFKFHSIWLYQQPNLSPFWCYWPMPIQLCITGNWLFSNSDIWLLWILKMSGMFILVNILLKIKLFEKQS